MIKIEKFRSLTSSSAEVIVIFKDGEGKWIDTNQHASELFSLETIPNGYVGKTTTEIAEYSPVVQVMLEGSGMTDKLAWEKGTVILQQETFCDASGKTHMYEFMKIPVFDHDRSRNHIITVGRNITDQLQSHTLLEESQQRFRSLFEHNLDPVYLLDTEGKFVLRNTATGAYTEEILGTSFRDLPITDKELTREKFDAALKGETQVYEIDVLDRDNRQRRLLITNIPIEINGIITGVYCIAKDLTELNEAHKQIHDLAYIDELTTLPNRRAFQEQYRTHMNAARSQSTPLVLMGINLDGTNHVNNTFGNLIGDELLKEASNRIRIVTGRENFLARTGGDEFVVLIADDVDYATKMAQQILEEVQKPFFIDDITLYVSASIGISSYPKAGINETDLLKNADLALRRAKENGKNQWWIYDPSMNIETYRQVILKHDLHKAIQDRKLLVHYQPKVNPISNRIAGVEALIRWEHEDWGLVSPTDFIPLAEENGLISAIGEWVLETVCQQIKAWDLAGLLEVPVAVNISGHQICKRGFVDQVGAILHEYGVSGDRLELEITESTIMHNENVVMKAISDFHKMGIRVALDDFGTGYSSLAQLTRYDFDTLKVDKTFIEDLHVNPDAAKLVKTIIQMAHGLGLMVVVEGVETSQQNDFLRKSACDEIQGYLYSRPVSTVEIEQLLRKEIIHPRTEQIHVGNRRKFYRVEMDYPLVSDMTIHTVHGAQIYVGNTEVLVQDIGPGGLRFVSHIRMPVNNKIVLRFTLQIFEEIELLGYTVWSNELRHERYEYGVQFIIKESERDSLTQLLNQLSIQLRTRPIVPNCRMWVDSSRNFFKRVR